MNVDEIARAVLDTLRAEGYTIIPPKRKPQRAPGDEELSAHALAGGSPDWSNEQIELLRALWPDAMIHTAEICHRLGRSPSAVKHKAQDIGVKRRIGRPSGEVECIGDDMRFWNDDRDAELRELAKQGCGDPEIAAVLGTTKNAVIGRRHRLHIELTQCQPGKRRPLMATARPHKAPKTPKKPKEAPKLQPAPFLAPEVVSMPQPALEPVEMLFAPMPKVDAPTGAGAAVLALRPRMCRWPINDPRDDDFHFCGAHRDVGATYCAAHARAAYGPGTPSERRAVRAAMKGRI